MNKSELIDSIANGTGLSKNKAGQALDSVLSAITEALKSGDTVTLVGFGAFSVKERTGRLGRNPSSGEEIQIPARKVPGFKPGKLLKIAVNGSDEMDSDAESDNDAE